MESRSRAEGRVTRTEAPRQRLYLVTPRVEDAASFAREVDLALTRRDVALLLDGHAEIAARAGADGAHISGIEAFVAALPMLKPDRIAGAGGLLSRHDAMLAGESGADYVMFGEPDRRGRRPAFDELEERLLWWADLLEIPCVGYADHPDEVATLARTGADFVALGEWIWTEPKGIAAAIVAAAEYLTAPDPR
jgi:thiamine-phosphate pyrophosphorylase